MKLRLASALALFFVVLSAPTNSAGPNVFAQCLKDKGAVMYSAWWCGYCYLQLHYIDPITFLKTGKEMREDVAQAQNTPGATILPEYQREMRDPTKMSMVPFVIECADPSTGNLTSPQCLSHNIRATPTWKLEGAPMGRSGMKTPEELSQATGCALPQ